MRTLYLLDEIGASFLFLTEDDARRAITDERARGLHVTSIGRVEVPDDDYHAYAEAVRRDVTSAHLHPVFQRVDHGGAPDYPTEWEQLCAGVCVDTGDEFACAEATEGE